MSGSRPWFPFYPSDYRADTLDLSTEQHGVYMTLLIFAWTWNGAIPNDMDLLKRSLQASFRDFHGHKFNALVPPILKRYFFLSDDGCFHQKRVDRELEKARKVSANARQSIEKRWSASKENKHLADTNVIQTQSQSDKEEKILPFGAATRCPPTAEERPVAKASDCVSDDGTIIISAEDIDRWNELYPDVNNIRGLCRNALRGWLKGRPYKEFMTNFETSIRNKSSANKFKKPTKTASERVDEKTKWEEQAAEGQRRLAARNRILGMR